LVVETAELFDMALQLANNKNNIAFPTKMPLTVLDGTSAMEAI